jgi:hypothetical protein
MPSSAIQIRWPCLSPCAVKQGTSGSQEASGTPSGMIRIPRPRGGTYLSGALRPYDNPHTSYFL